jgi:pimeloyl-ACP methyl ester carboxylesterase
VGQTVRRGQSTSFEIWEKEQRITLPDGRKLGYLIVGEGKPVLYFHGIPSSRLDVLFLKEIAGSRKLKVIGVDRPGFGLSTFAPRKSLRDFAADVNYLTDYLGIERFAIVGFSAGGPYAITYAAMFPERVTRVIVTGSPSLPYPNLDEYYKGLQKVIAWLEMKVPHIGMWFFKRFRNVLLKAAKDPGEFLESKEGKEYLETISKDDVRFLFTNQSIMKGLFRSAKEFFCQGDDGVKSWYEEILLFMKGWDMDLSQIPTGLVHIWHGTTDKNVLVADAYRNEKAIPGAHLEIFEGKGHFLWLDNLEKLVETLI